MASSQEKMERAEAEAKQALLDIAYANRQREYEERAKTTTFHGQNITQEEDNPGVFGSVFSKVADTFGLAKDAVVGKRHEASEKTKEGTYTAAEKAEGTADKAGEYTAEKAKEVTDSDARKANEAKNYTAEKANQAKDYAAEKANQAKDKAVEYKDYTAEKAKEAKDYSGEKAGKDEAFGKLGGLAESAKGAARKAMDLLTGNKEEVQDKTTETAHFTKGNLREAEEETRRKLEEMRMEDEANKKNIEAERGSAARETIFGNIGAGEH